MDVRSDGPRTGSVEARRRAGLIARGRWEEADRLAERSGGFAGLVYVPGGEALAHSAGEHQVDGDPLEGRELALKALLLANRGVDRAVAVESALAVLESPARLDAVCFWTAVMVLTFSDELERAETACGRAEESAEWTGTAGCRDTVGLLRARIHAMSGRTEEAIDLLLVQLSSGGLGRLTGIAVAWAVSLLADRGEIAAANDLLEGNGFTGSMDHAPDRAELLAARGGLHLSGGNFERGLDDFLACGRELDARSVTNSAVIAWRTGAALCAAAIERRDLAFALANEDAAHAATWATPRRRAVALHVLAVARRAPRSVDLLKQAVALLDGLSCPELYRAGHDLAVLLGERGDLDEARSVLESARAVAERGGNAFWAKRLETAVRQLGVSDAVALTRQELAAAKLARAGYSNKQIAEKQMVTPRMVELHLSSVYRK
ncbi:MAG: LuxR C-terminal-related transcriptional regulator, partial [Umezawaea sp.]